MINSVSVSLVSHVMSYVMHMCMRVRIAIALALLPLFHAQSETTMAEGPEYGDTVNVDVPSQESVDWGEPERAPH